MCAHGVEWHHLLLISLSPETATLSSFSIYFCFSVSKKKGKKRKEKEKKAYVNISHLISVVGIIVDFLLWRMRISVSSDTPPIQVHHVGS